MMRRFAPRLLLVAGTVLSLACDSLFDPLSDDRRRLDSAHARWLAAGISDYEFVVRNECFCGFGGVAVRIVVQHGAIVSRTIVSTGQPVPDESAGAFRDVEALFDLLRDALGGHPAKVQASYNGTYGYPTNVFIDYSKNVADEEFGFVIDSFTKR